MPAPTSSLAGRLADRDRAVDLGLRGWIDQQRGAEPGRRQDREAVISVRGVHAITRGFWLPRPTLAISGQSNVHRPALRVAVTAREGHRQPGAPKSC
jgi:hypothetical protein